MVRPFPINQLLHQPNRAALFWPIRTMPYGPIMLWRFRVLICMRTNQSGAGVGTSLCTSELLLGAHFPFPLKTVFSWLELKHQRCITGAEQSRPAWVRADWNRVEQTNARHRRPTRSREPSYLVGGGPVPRATWLQGCLTAMLFSQLCYTTINVFCSE